MHPPLAANEVLATALGAVTLGRANQRNWSRVAAGTTEGGEPVFVKQFRDARGRHLAALFDAELATTAELTAAHPSTFTIIAPLAALHERATLVYPWHELETLDALADRSPDSRPKIAAALAEFVDELAERGWAWKGLDVKNLALAADGRLTVFDFGPTYRAPIAEPVARIVGSALVAHWGRPLTRTVSGPPEWLSEVLGPLLPRTAATDVRRFLDRVRRVRSEEPQATGVLERLAIRPATVLLARRYWRQCEEWVSTNLS